MHKPSSGLGITRKADQRSIAVLCGIIIPVTGQDTALSSRIVG
jgi:hypothetical protein